MGGRERPEVTAARTTLYGPGRVAAGRAVLLTHRRLIPACVD